jgi:stage II sporulation protein P
LAWRALGGYLALAAVGLLLALRGPARGGAAAASSAWAPPEPPAGRTVAVGDVLAWVATGSADGPFALLRAVLPGMGLPAPTAGGRAVSPPSQPPDPPDTLHATIHHPLASDEPAPAPFTVYGVGPRVLVYETDPGAAALGRELARDLFSGYGIPTAYIRTPFGGLDPYLAAEPALEAAMRAYPTLRVLFDIHADQPAAGEALTAEVAGAPAARVMIVVGDDATLPEPDWRQNAAWALQLAAAIRQRYPGLLRTYQGRPFYADGGRFDQQLSPAALLLAIGGRGVPPDQELRSADLLAEVLGPLIRAGRYPG